jgi:hypothetical protein
LEEKEKALCGDPGDQRKCASRHSKHQERAKIVIARLAAQGRFSCTPTGPLGLVWKQSRSKASLA